MSKRPYYNKSTYELASSFDANRRNLSALKAIAHELTFRSPKRTKTLQIQVNDRIAALTSGETAINPTKTKKQPGIIENVPSMKMSQLMELWNNAVRLSEEMNEAKSVINAIETEWKRRAANPPSQDEYFNWPSTEADCGDGRLTADGWAEEGVLSYMGYRVGNTMGLATNIRRRILEQIFQGELPPVFPPDYLNSWDKPNTAARLKKMAETLAAFARNAKRKRGSKMTTAVMDWEKDLQFLYQNFYLDHFSFAWPTTEL